MADGRGRESRAKDGMKLEDESDVRGKYGFCSDESKGREKVKSITTLSVSLHTPKI